MTCNEGEIVSPNLTIHHQTVQKSVLHQGEMIYVPQGWAFIAQTRGGRKAITIAEARMTSEGIEEAATLGEQEVHLIKKGLDGSFDILWTRFTEILKQRRRNKK